MKHGSASPSGSVWPLIIYVYNSVLSTYYDNYDAIIYFVVYHIRYVVARMVCALGLGKRSCKGAARPDRPDLPGELLGAHRPHAGAVQRLLEELRRKTRTWIRRPAASLLRVLKAGCTDPEALPSRFGILRGAHLFKVWKSFGAEARQVRHRCDSLPCIEKRPSQARCAATAICLHDRPLQRMAARDMREALPKATRSLLAACS